MEPRGRHGLKSVSLGHVADCGPHSFFKKCLLKNAAAMEHLPCALLCTSPRRHKGAETQLVVCTGRETSKQGTGAGRRVPQQRRGHVRRPLLRATQVQGQHLPLNFAPSVSPMSHRSPGSGKDRQMGVERSTGSD